MKYRIYNSYGCIHIYAINHATQQARYLMRIFTSEYTQWGKMPDRLVENFHNDPWFSLLQLEPVEDYNKEDNGKQVFRAYETDNIDAIIEPYIVDIL